MDLELSTNFYQKFVKPLLFCLPPEKAHKCAMEALKVRYKFLRTPEPYVSVKGLSVGNKVGIAAGFDKDGEYIDTLAKLGFGYIEVGTVTPLPQPGNEKPRLHRFPEHESLVNSMGFNNSGVDVLVNNLRNANYRGAIGVNIGKNSKTPVENAFEDYSFCIDRVYEYASYIVVNISSPNTKDLRTLQSKKFFRPLIDDLKSYMLDMSEKHDKYVPLFVKVSPDEDADSLKHMIEVLCEFDVDGLIVANTTLSPEAKKRLGAEQLAGGVSGSLLKELSRESLRTAKRYSGGKLCLVSVGGIDSAEEVKLRESLGADLVQIYSGLIFKGPQLIKDILADQRENLEPIDTEMVLQPMETSR